MPLDPCVRYLTCPHCHGPLTGLDPMLRCADGHTFDVAREGYINLLASGRRLPATVGDTREMLLARARFLARGHYAPLSKAINRLAGEHLAAIRLLAGAQPLAVLDAGCGTGHYLAHLKAHVDALLGAGGACYCGTDIAREAARLAAKRHPGIVFLVADTTKRLPLADGSVTVLLNSFAPRNPREFARVTAPGGLLLVAIPRPAHLAEPRAVLPLLSIEPDKQQHVIDQLAGSFAPAGETVVEHPLHLGNDDLRDLLAMTPSYRHLPPETWDTVRTLATVHATASFAVLAFRRVAD